MLKLFKCPLIEQNLEFRENLDTNYSGECSLDSSQSHTVDRMLGVLIIYYD